MKSSFEFSERYGGAGGGYRDLMRHQVRHVLLVSSLYESFILAEDGHLHERILGKFVEAGDRVPPDLARVSSGREALDVLSRDGRRVDLVASSPRVADMDAADLAAAMREAGHDVPLAVLGYDEIELREFMDTRSQEGILASFLYQGDARILLTIVRAVEDRLNVDRDTRVGTPVFLVVEDNVRHYSSFLPVIYSEVVSLSQAVRAEAGNRLQRILRMRARPKLLLATCYERAWALFERYRDSIMGVFTDMEFPREGVRVPTAGQDLVRAIRAEAPEVPVAFQSSRVENRAVAMQMEAGFLLKESPEFLGQLRTYLGEHLFFGDFVFRMPDGIEVDRAGDLKSLVDRLRTVPAESVAFHASRHDFSRWLRARGELGLAAQFRPRLLEDYPTVEDLRASLVHDIDRYRRERNRGTVTPFRAGSFDAEEGIVQIGGGSLGGKGRGLAFASRMLDEAGLAERIPGVRIHVPAAAVVGTSVFDRFLDDNGLRSFALQSEAHDETRRRILASPLPDDVRAALRRVVEVVRGPLAVRSSSLLEDNPHQPLSGIYGTWLIPNGAPDATVRMEQLATAVKQVYASTFSARARAFLQATGYRLEEEAMAVVIERVVGARHGSRFYPHLAGVARSHNYYPTPPARPQDGVAAVALGLGRTVASGEPCLRFVPAHPGHIIEHHSVESLLETAQRDFWALDLDGLPGPDGWPEHGALRRFPLSAARDDGTLAPVASVYSAENQAVYDGMGRPGVPLVTFAPILKHGVFPLAQIIESLLIVGMSGTRQPVEIEFAATLPAGPDGDADFGFLQLRPLAPSREGGDVELDDIAPEDTFCDSPAVLGNGRIEDLRDWIVVDRERFERGRSGEVARSVAALNDRLRETGRSFGLIGVGRWGSSQPWLGIPVRWEDISGARVIVEAGLRDFRVTPSQGTHFYQNLISLNVGYFTVNEDTGEGFVDWTWLKAQPRVEERGAVAWIRLDEPATAILNGRDRRGVLVKPGVGRRREDRASKRAR